MKVQMTRGYVIADEADLTLADFEDACADNHDKAEDGCDSTFDNWICTRLLRHTGPHIAATGPDAVTAIWEEDRSAYHHES